MCSRRLTTGLRSAEVGYGWSSRTSNTRSSGFRSEKVREMAQRGGAAMSLDVLQALDHGIEIGRGGIWLELSDEQYQKLRIQIGKSAGDGPTRRSCHEPGCAPGA